ncbi:phosphoribosylanthranilate isomerase [Flammeovirgaceae bacterium SG7u.111]|nr:phosphoribosylanthranilate isomerase [Flammeovirgaceae bacterium SG7u.132]WPO35231.1 phosphoribosylanthranilate isomerase [Flammeovirgaceae bacterium SG7u.111]
MERRIKLKVCGLKIEENLSKVVALAPDYIGFIFYEKSSRFVGNLSPEFARSLPASIKRTGVFVNASSDFIKTKTIGYGLKAIQLHGTETPSFCEELKNILPPQTELIKAFSMGDTFDFSSLSPYLPCCDFFLFDTKGKHPGGNGVIFDWSLLKEYPYDKPFFLSGGIGLEHAGSIKEISLPQIHAVDINSKFEIAPGLKNIEDLAQFDKVLY